MTRPQHRALTGLIGAVLALSLLLLLTGFFPFAAVQATVMIGLYLDRTQYLQRTHSQPWAARGARACTALVFVGLAGSFFQLAAIDDAPLFRQVYIGVCIVGFNLFHLALRHGDRSPT